MAEDPTSGEESAEKTASPEEATSAGTGGDVPGSAAEPTPQQKARRALKQRIASLVSEREAARSQWSPKDLNRARRRLHRLRRRLRNAARAI